MTETSDIKPAKVKKKKKKKKVTGSAKGLETMFRNAYRAQLDFISLAATKANIMISLNGFIVSVLLVSGGFLYNSAPVLLLPIVLFMVTSGISIYFALLSAAPSHSPLHKDLLPCLSALFKGKVGLRDFGSFIKLPARPFDDAHSNILVFEDFSRLSKEAYQERMNALISNPDDVYEKMSDQLYIMGQMANKAFRQLGYSYATFRWGLIVSIFLFVGLKASILFFPQHSVARSHVAAQTGVLKFKSIYEPSGVVQLPDGRLIIIEDEKVRPWHVLGMTAKGRTHFDEVLSRKLRQTFKKDLVDLEAITQGPDDYYYAITSHHRNKKGKRRPQREQLVRFKIDDNEVVDSAVYNGLMDIFKASNIVGKTDEKGEGGLYNLNIEAMSFDKQNRLMLGLRAPQIDGKSIIVVIENPEAIFIHGEKARFMKKPVLLDLHGSGFRAMVYDQLQDGYLIANELFGSDSGKRAQILYWDGDFLHQPIVLSIPNLNLKNIEGITPVILEGERYILVVSDNGDLKTGNGANYQLLSYQEITHNRR